MRKTLKQCGALLPMPLQQVRQPFDHRDWLYELKLDGFRALAHVNHGRCELISRKGNRLNGFQPLCDAIAKELGNVSAILDGEIVCLNHKDGRSIFNDLCYRRTDPYFYAFDLLLLDGTDWRHRPLLRRKEQLAKLIPMNGRLRYLGHIDGVGSEFFRLCCKMDLEGVVAKLKTAPYVHAREASTWVKIKNPHYTQAEGRREIFHGTGNF